jgi:hypothetical protein
MHERHTQVPLRSLPKTLKKYTFPDWTSQLEEPLYAMDLVQFAEHLASLTPSADFMSELYHQMQEAHQKKRRRRKNAGNDCLIRNIEQLGRLYDLDIHKEWKQYCKEKEQSYVVYSAGENKRVQFAYFKWMREVVFEMQSLLKDIPFLVFDDNCVRASHSVLLATQPGARKQALALSKQIRLEVCFPDEKFRVRVPCIGESGRKSWAYDSLDRTVSLPWIRAIAHTNRSLASFLPSVLADLICAFLIEPIEPGTPILGRKNFLKRKRKESRPSKVAKRRIVMDV